MSFKRIELLELTPENFAPYGQVFSIPSGENASCITERFNFSPRLATFDMHRGTNQLQLGISTFLKRPFRFEQMERHYTSEEIMVALDKRGVIITFAKHDTDAPGEKPQADRAVAFHIPPLTGIVVSRYVWHWTPMPLDNKSSIICCFETGTEIDDVDIMQFADPCVVEVNADAFFEE